MAFPRVAAVLCLLLVVGCGTASPSKAPAVSPSAVPASARSHIVTIVMENKEASSVIGNGSAPYTNSLARRYGLATRSYGIRHPSLPNYLALTSGSTHGITDDCTDCHVAGGSNLAAQLESHHLSWKSYLEGMPTPCFTGASSGNYAKKHNPFSYYDNIANNPARCAHLVPFTQLAKDLRRGALPTYSLITPDLCDDTHDCGVDKGDQFLARTVPGLLKALGPHGFLIVTYDEGSSNAGCCGGAAAGGLITTIVAGPDVKRGGRQKTAVSHYGVLRTVEDALRLPRLGAAKNAANGSLSGLFKVTPRVARGSG